jgi:ribonuclease III
MDHPRMMEKVQACEAIIDHVFNDPLLCWEALQVAGSGVSHSGTHCILNGNKRLAVVGDAVIDLILSKDWFESGANESDSPAVLFLRNNVLIFVSGYWTDIRMRVSSNANLHAVGIAVGLNSCMHVNPRNPVYFSPKIMATAVEAVIGTVFLDGGLVATRTSMHVLGLAYNAPGINMVTFNRLSSTGVKPNELICHSRLYLQMTDPGEACNLFLLPLLQCFACTDCYKVGSGSNIARFPGLAPVTDT